MTIIDNYINNKKGDFANNFTRGDINNFFGDVCNRFLHSYGQNFKNKKSYKNYNKNEAELYTKLRASGFYDRSLMISDSGGFQTSVGLLDRRESLLLFENYYKFLEEYHDVLDLAFILDVPPGPGCQMFTSFTDVYNLNLESYTTAANLPDEVRKKIIYIHHFRTPELWKIYTKILRDNDFYSKFEYFGTGGIVANSSGDAEIPCIIYTLPIIPLLNETIRHNRDTLNFHVLGGATYRDILFYEIFKIHVLHTHGIILNITYDSSGLFKALMIGRYIHILSDDVVKKMDIRSPNLDKRFKNENNVLTTYFNALNDLAKKHNFTEISLDRIYSEVTGTFHDEIKIYTMLYMLDFYARVEELMREKAQKIYPLYLAGDMESYNSELEQITRNLNGGKITKKQTSKSTSVVKSLDMLTNLDENFCEYLVERFMSKDEFNDLIDNRKILTF